MTENPEDAEGMEEFTSDTSEGPDDPGQGPGGSADSQLATNGA